MGNTSYNSSDRVFKAASKGYATKSKDDIFEQSKVRRVHESMDSKSITLRECRDSEAHPNTIPIILNLDVTGSMGDIPHALIKNGLPTLMSTLIENGADDASLLFTAIGDHKSDNYPLQIGQFESGNDELDMWLERTYLEGNGGGNGGESYPLAWYFAAYHTAIDSFEKRGKKGFLFTVGDEPFHREIPKSAMNEIMTHNKAEGTLDAHKLYEEASKSYHVYHLHITHGGGRPAALLQWKELLGENCIEVTDYTTLPQIISKVILSHKETSVSQPEASIKENKESTTPSTSTDTQML